MVFTVLYGESSKAKEVQADSIEEQEGVSLSDVLSDSSSFLKDGFVVADAIGRVAGVDFESPITVSDVIVDSIGSDEEAFLDYAEVMVDFAQSIGACESMTDDLFSDDDDVAQDALEELQGLMSSVIADGVSPFDVATSYMMSDVISDSTDGLDDDVELDSVMMDYTPYDDMKRCKEGNDGKHKIASTQKCEITAHRGEHVYKRVGHVIGGKKRHKAQKGQSRTFDHSKTRSRWRKSMKLLGLMGKDNKLTPEAKAAIRAKRENKAKARKNSQKG